MSKHPIINGLSASLYIILVVLVMNSVAKKVPHPNMYIVPIVFISLFTLSAAIMGYIFCYQPAQWYFEGKKKQAVTLFLQTVGVFGAMTVLTIILMFFGKF